MILVLRTEFHVRIFLSLRIFELLFLELFFITQPGSNHQRRCLHCFAANKDDQQLRMIYGFSNNFG